ncbi:unnamed protein product [Chironomus riparius]|uniref:Uncharacterized protein n=1 Tax=Chironomus riparius TaxID=315576 RepID=A0A9N9WYB5_9DIPT|nr:unnamed protein product [Chironomus riparius]
MNLKTSIPAIFILTYVAISFIQPAQSCTDTCTADEIKAFEKFKQEFYKSYSTAADECTARGIFCKNYRKIIDNNNNSSSTYKMAVTSSTDQLSEDSRSTGMVDPPPLEVAKRNTTSAKLIRKAKKVKANQFAQNTVKESSGNVNNGPLTGPVKDQGNCGSCWAFCSAAVLQYQAKVYQNRTIEVSEQDFLECNAYASMYGCNGGNPIFAMTYAYKTGVIPMVKYPYRQTKEACRRSSSMGQNYPTLGDVTMANANGDESVLRRIIDSYGVIAIAMGTTTGFTSYSSGVFDDPACPTKVSHCVGTDWGEAGYFRMKRGTNTCGIETANYYVVVPK